MACPGVIPLVLTIIWRKQSKIAAIASAFLGLGTGFGTWLGTAYAFSGEVSIASTGGTLPCMYGTVASLFSPGIYSVVISLLKPDNYDWAEFKEHKLAVDSEGATSSGSESHAGVESPGKTATDVSAVEEISTNSTQRRWARYALWWAIATFLGHWVLWPLPMYAANYIFSKQV